jgi:hypothetical protein
MQLSPPLLTLLEQPAQKPIAPMLERVASLFLRKRGMWIDSSELEQVGGRCAWRTRVSECRTLLGMDISNRVRTVQADGRRFRVSEYAYKPTGDVR